MPEPENHTLRLLREFREETREFQSRADQNVTNIKDNVAAIKGEIFDIKASLDTLARAVAGEIVQTPYATAGVDERLAEIERRLIALEQVR